ncbi:MAG TPA: alginate lyase family protein [Chitinophaga sp.]|uniref:alginate lyase family protein n=1 Tax=Chitinophaga sp. TaxID=1869181 RepID=UPI002BC79551|nr:alginate lyase family protein [Chitinophaga sp.]HVI43395.1 alginate lyase family protein [Chitinophaga sp.]
MRYLFIVMLMINAVCVSAQTAWQKKVLKDMRPAIMQRAKWAMQQQPQTVTSYRCVRSAGGLHDFYSEGDYWWPDPEHPDGPYIQRDGQSNPDNFVAHRQAMIRFSRVMGALAAAYMASKDRTYLQHALKHAKAWFEDSATRMNPNLLYAQAIKGRVTGRGIGIIDTLQFLEVVQALRIMEKAGAIPPAELTAFKAWFTSYLEWMTTHPYGKDEMNAANNHGTCWVAQVAAFSLFVNNKPLIDSCINRYKTVLLPSQMDADGSFPRELKRTKPYGYSLFNLDAMSAICQLLSGSGNDLWRYTVEEERNMGKGISFMYPYVKDKTTWPLAHDVMYWSNWPVAQPFLLFGAAAFDNEAYYRLWLSLDHDPQEEEVLRNLPVRNPVIFL